MDIYYFRHPNIDFLRFTLQIPSEMLHLRNLVYLIYLAQNAYIS